MPRPRKRRLVEWLPVVETFHPETCNEDERQTLQLPIDGLEAIRLCDLLGLDHETASRRMDVSRQTFGRILAHARRIVAEALVTGCSLKITGGDCMVTCRAGAGKGMRHRRRRRGHR